VDPTQRTKGKKKEEEEGRISWKKKWIEERKWQTTIYDKS